MEVKFIKTNEDAILPRKNHNDWLLGDAGLDLFSTQDVEIPPGGSVVVDVGLKLAFITPGYWFRIEPRSGLGFKQGVQPHLGIIDNGYRGDLGVKLYNFSDKPAFIEKGKGVAQFIVYKMIHATCSFVDVATKSERGEKGFGSSDVTS